MSELDDFEGLLRQHGPAIYSLALRLCSNRADGEDLAQETFVKAYEKREQFREAAAVKTWLFRICMNLWKNRVRYEKRRSFWRHLSLGFRGRDGDEPELNPPADLPEMGSAVEKAEDQKKLEAALQELETDERVILILRDVNGESYEAIAEQLDIPVGTVRSRLARSRDRLRQIFLERPVAETTVEKD